MQVGPLGIADAIGVFVLRAPRQNHLHTQHLTRMAFLVGARHVGVGLRHQVLDCGDVIAGSRVKVRGQRADFVQLGFAMDDEWTA